MRRIFIMMMFTLLSLGSSSASPYRISVLSCGAGDQVYSTFGHTAIRVTDSLQRTDIIYNFGMFHFDDPNFVLKFLKGDLDYFLGLENLRHFMYQYTIEDRIVLEQVLDVTEEQAVNIIQELNYRYLPENRSYKYKFLRRNCTTEVRDIVTKYTDVNREYLDILDPHTYRYYLNDCMRNQPWLRTGINLILGSAIDIRITNYEKMFLPMRFYEGLEMMTNGGEPTVTEDKTLFMPENAENEIGFFGRYYPLMIMIILAFAVILLNSRVSDAIYLFILGLLGALIVFLMIYGLHFEFKNNLNLFFCNPLMILFGIFILLKKKKASFIMAVITSLSILAMYIVWIFGIQWPEPAFIVFSIPAALISYKYIRAYRNIRKREA